MSNVLCSRTIAHRIGMRVLIHRQLSGWDDPLQAFHYILTEYTGKEETKENGMATTTAFLADRVETHYIDGPTARFAYRRFGPLLTPPLVLAMRLRGTIDHWDPAFLDLLATERNVIIFDNCGVGASTGTPADTIAGLADGLIEFVEALRLPYVDFLGWSMGGYVVECATLKRPDLVRRIVVAGSGPGKVPNLPPAPEKVWQVAGKPVNDDEDFLYLFYPDTPVAREAGLASLRRLDTRLAVSHAEVAPAAAKAQITAIQTFGIGVWDQLDQLTLPVLVGNGAHDVMISSYATYAMSQRLPNAKIVLYSDAGHGFLFQHYQSFGDEVLRFLR